MAIPDRSQWPRALTSVPRARLAALTDALTEGWEIRPKALPQSGLAMLRMTDAAFHEPFYLGEIPLATAWLEIRTSDNRVAEGAAQVMDDSVDLAQQLAICDAVVGNRLEGWERVLALISVGEQRISDERRRRKAMLANTRVDFSLLDAVSGGDED